MPKGTNGGAAAKPSNVRTVFFTPAKVTKGAIRFVEATATGKPKTQSKSVWRNMYARLYDAEGGLGDMLNEDGDISADVRLKVTIEIEGE